MKSIAADFLRIIFLFLLSAVAQAQQDSIKNISLPEIEVSGDNIIPKKDGYIFFPTQSQRDHAGNGLDLLEQMKLPGVHIDFLEKSMTYTRVHINNYSNVTSILQSWHRNIFHFRELFGSNGQNIFHRRFYIINQHNNPPFPTSISH